MLELASTLDVPQVNQSTFQRYIISVWILIISDSIECKCRGTLRLTSVQLVCDRRCTLFSRIMYAHAIDDFF